MPDDDYILETALELARSGIEVFALQPQSKEPYKGSKGHLDATRDPRVVREMFSALPRSNIGARVPSDVAVVDIDSVEADHALRVAYEVPATTQVKTRRGFHLWYRWPVELGPSPTHTKLFKVDAGEPLSKVDLKGNTGYVLMPPT